MDNKSAKPRVFALIVDPYPSQPISWLQKRPPTHCIAKFAPSRGGVCCIGASIMMISLPRLRKCHRPADAIAENRPAGPLQMTTRQGKWAKPRKSRTRRQPSSIVERFFRNCVRRARLGGNGRLQGTAGRERGAWPADSAATGKVRYLKEIAYLCKL